MTRAKQSAFDYLPDGFLRPGGPGLRALSFTQPWASLVAYGHKRFETRSWATREPYMGTIALHATAKPDKEFCRDENVRVLLGADYEFPVSAIIGLMNVRKCHRTDSLVLPGSFDERNKEYAFGDFSTGRYAWEITHVLRFDDPVRTGGALALWRVPAEVEKQIVHRLSREDFIDLNHVTA